LKVRNSATPARGIEKKESERKNDVTKSYHRKESSSQEHSQWYEKEGEKESVGCAERNSQKKNQQRRERKEDGRSEPGSLWNSD